MTRSTLSATSVREFRSSSRVPQRSGRSTRRSTLQSISSRKAGTTMTWIERLAKWRQRTPIHVPSLEEVSEATYSKGLEASQLLENGVSTRFINHLEAEIVELRAENMKL